MVASAVVSDLAPGGTLRAAINFDNAILASKDAATGEPGGISAELARRLGVTVAFAARLTFVATGIVWVVLLAFGAAQVRGFLGGHPDAHTLLNRTMGGLFVFLGFRLAAAPQS
jgi:hypothetical protein